MLIAGTASKHATPSALPDKLNGLCYASWAHAGADSFDSIQSDARFVSFGENSDLDCCLGNGILDFQGEK